MNIQQQRARADEQTTMARAHLRHPGTSDQMLDYWAERLTFWREEAKRLDIYADAEREVVR